jgi:hypothetical protein
VFSAVASSWTALRGSVTSGSAGNLAVSDGSYLLHRSVKSGSKTVADGSGAPGSDAGQTPSADEHADGEGH